MKRLPLVFQNPAGAIKNRSSQKDIKTRLAFYASKMKFRCFRPIDELSASSLLECFYILMMFGLQNEQRYESGNHKVINSHASTIEEDKPKASATKIPIDNTTASIVNC